MPRPLVPPPITTFLDDPANALCDGAMMLDWKGHSIWLPDPVLNRSAEALYAPSPPVPDDPADVATIFGSYLVDSNLLWIYSARESIRGLALHVLTCSHKDQKFGAVGFLYHVAQSEIVQSVLTGECFDAEGVQKVVDRSMSSPVATTTLRRCWPCYKADLPKGYEVNPAFGSWKSAVLALDVNAIDGCFMVMAERLHRYLVRPLLVQLLDYTLFIVMREKRYFGNLVSLRGSQLGEELEHFRSSQAFLHFVTTSTSSAESWPNKRTEHPDPNTFYAMVTNPSGIAFRHFVHGAGLDILRLIIHWLSGPEGPGVVDPFTDDSGCPIQKGPMFTSPSTHAPYPCIEASLVLPHLMVMLAFDIIKENDGIPKVPHGWESKPWVEATFFTEGQHGPNPNIVACYQSRDWLTKQIQSFMLDTANHAELAELETYLALTWVTSTGNTAHIGSKLLSASDNALRTASSSADIRFNNGIQFHRKVVDAVLNKWDPSGLISRGAAAHLFNC